MASWNIWELASKCLSDELHQNAHAFNHRTILNSYLWLDGEYQSAVHDKATLKRASLLLMFVAGPEHVPL
jgi:hypothetical protein